MKLKRYHIDIYCPDWTRKSILEFIGGLKEIKLKYSYHANHKILKMGKKYKNIVKTLINQLIISDEIYLDYVFEFYARNENIKKVCYRFPMKDLDTDIILVISDKGKIVTIYLNDNFDKHFSLNKSLYEQRPQVKENI